MRFPSTAIPLLLFLRRVSFPHRLCDVGDDRRTKEQIYQIRIELRSATIRDRLHRLLQTASGAVAPPMGDGVERVRDRDDAGGERNPFSLQLPGITGAVPSLVMRCDSLPQVGVEGDDRAQHLGTALRMRPDSSPLLRGKLGVFVKNVGERFVQLPDVVEERDPLDTAPGVLIVAGRPRKDVRERRDSADVSASFRVVGINGVEQRLERGGAQPLRAGPATPFPEEESAGGDAKAEA